MKNCPPHKPLYNPKTDRCIMDTPANRKKVKAMKQPVVKPAQPVQPKQPTQPVVPVQKKKCPPHKPVYNPKTERCVLDTEANRKKVKAIQEAMKQKELKNIIQNRRKICPPEKPLYNPITNRCVMNTLANRKKIGIQKKTKKITIAKSKDFFKDVKTYKKDTKKNVITFYEYFQSLYKATPLEIDFLQSLQSYKQNIWSGSPINELISIIYVLLRHKSTCSMVPVFKTPRVYFEKFEIAWTITKNVSDTKFISNDYFHKRYSKLITSKRVNNKQKVFLTVPKDLNIANTIELCKKYNKRFAFVLVGLANEILKKSHSNCIIYDIKKNEIELFEPHGGDNVYLLSKDDNYHRKLFYTELTKYLKSILPVKKIYMPMDYCPVGPQMYDGRIHENPVKIINRAGGYCAAWSIYYLDARFSNPDVPRDLLIDKFIEKYRKESLYFINNYSNFILNLFRNSIKKYRPLYNKVIRDKGTREERYKLYAIISNRLNELIINL